MQGSPEPTPEQADIIPANAFSTLVPDHTLLRVIGKGNYGEVWLARNKLGTLRAVKIVFEKSFRHKRPFDREFNGVRKFEPISRLHDGLVDILQVGGDEAGHYFYCVMELADDAESSRDIDPDKYVPRTLAADIAKHKRLPVAECRRIGIAVGQALDFLHHRGLIHRDVKPSNIVFVNGVPKLADIGLVAEISEARSYVGTEGFIPPEGPGTAQADLYSLGKVLYEISTGKDRHEFPELPTAIDDAQHETELAALNRILLKACRADVTRRYRLAGEMVADLLVTGEANRSPRLFESRAMRIAVGVIVLAVLLGAAGLTLKSKTRNARASSPASPDKGPASVDTGPVAYWAGDGDEQDNAGENDGEAMGGVDYSAGQIDRAFLFNGTNAQVKIAATPALDIGAGEAFTIAAWVNPADISTRSPLFEWNNGQGAWGIHLSIDPFCRPNEVNPGTLFANLEDTNHNWHIIDSDSGVVSSNVFQHVALTFEKHFDKDHSLATLYCNGVAVARRTFGPFTPLSSFDLYLGRRPSSEVQSDIHAFKGLMDEVVILRRALSSNEIRLLYEGGIHGNTALTGVPAPADLVSWWPGGNSAADRVGGNDGIMMGGGAYSSGRVGKGFGFSGKMNGYVEVSDSPSLQLTNEVTIEFWIRRTDLFGSDYVVEKGGDWTLERLNYGVGIAPQRHKFKNVLFFAFAGGNRHSTEIGDLKWHHVAVTARNGDRDPIFYIDGVPQPVVRREGDPGKGADRIFLYPSPSPLHIGALVDEASEHTTFGTATIDELSIYKRVLSAAEIQSIHRAGRRGKVLSANESSALTTARAASSSLSASRR